MHNPALDAWGDYDRDDPYPLFAQVQADGPVHQVTLADGHRAWLILRHAEARAALSHPGLSKDMHAALARDGAVVAAGLPGPAFARHMLSVDPPDHTRLRRLASAAFSRPRIAALRPRVQAITDRLLDDLAAPGDPVVDLVQGLAFPLPFTVISELLGVPGPDRDQLGNWFTTLLTPSSAPEPPAEAVAASADIVRYLTGLLARKRAEPGEDLVTDLVRAADQDSALSEQEMLSTIFQLVVAGHDTTTSLIGNGTVALLLHPHQRDALVPGPVRQPAGSRHHPGGHQPPRLRPRHSPLPGRPAGPARGRDSVHGPARPLPRHAAGGPTVGAALGPRRRAGTARPDRAAGHPPPVMVIREGASSG